MTPTATPASVVFEGLTFTYPGAEASAVSDIHLTVEPGELVVLVGPSGCGKSTLLRIAAGLLQPDQGRLLIDGSDMLGIAPEQRRAGWVPQSYALFDHLSVSENIAFGLRMRGISKDERQERVAAMLELCQIPELARRPVSELSGGQRQRVAIARALAPWPRVLLLDEPLGALDPQLRLTLRGNLEALLRESGVTTLFVTHDQGEALAIADRIAVLRDGRIEQYHTPEQLWNRPLNAFVANFLSSAQVVQARRVDTATVEIAPGLLASVPPDVVPQATNGHVTIALRSTDLCCTPDGVAVVVTGAEYIGGTYVVTGQVPGGPQLFFRSSRELAPEEQVTIGLSADAQIAVVGP
jgi:ABC-type Fe3+/spermidine/putrescine transport system ATPase subunit